MFGRNKLGIRVGYIFGNSTRVDEVGLESTRDKKRKAHSVVRRREESLLYDQKVDLSYD